MPRDRRKCATVAGLGLALVLALAAPSFAQSSTPTPPAKVLWSKVRSFRIPVTLSAKNPGRTRELVLFISDDRGNFWKKAGKTTPDSLEFPVRVARDGEYWFAVQTVDVDGRLYPSGDKQVEPTLRVIVDSTKPTIILEPSPRRGSDAGIRWEVQDEHLVLKTLMLEYQQEGARDWRQVPLDVADLKLIGVKTWDAGTADAVRVRMSVRDKAQNVQTVEQILPDGLAENPGPAVAEVRTPRPPRVVPSSGRPTNTEPGDDAFDAPVSGNSGSTAEPTDVLPTPADRDFEPEPGQAQTAPRGNPTPNPAPAAAAPTLLVGSPKFPLKYEVEDAGPNGPALVELWITRDGGRTWSRQPEDADHQSPYNVDLGGEGTFGLWLVVQSASGLGDPPPAPGDRPQSWVEVDSAAPVVSMDRPRVGTAANAGKVAITWRAGDSHLAPKPITIAYRPDGTDAWVTIADRIENSGRFIWTAPTNVPPKFHIKVEAVDTLGNRGQADTVDSGPLLLDRARPKGRIVGLDPAGGSSRQ